MISHAEALARIGHDDHTQRIRFCVRCDKLFFVTNPLLSCAVAHLPGDCCHYGQTEIDPATLIKEDSRVGLLSESVEWADRRADASVRHVTEAQIDDALKAFARYLKDPGVVKVSLSIERY